MPTSDFLTLETTQGPVVVRRLAIDMLVPVSEEETVVTIGAAQLVVKATLEELELGVKVPKGWFRPLAEAPDKLAAMRAAGVSARAPMVSPQPRPGRVAVPITPQADLPQRKAGTQVAAPPRPAPRSAPPAPPRDGSDVAAGLRDKVETAARAAAKAINPNPQPETAPQPSKRAPQRAPQPQLPSAAPRTAAKVPSKPQTPSKPQRPAKGRR
jgi:hypothetical protein